VALREEIFLFRLRFPAARGLKAFPGHRHRLALCAEGDGVIQLQP
jgi:hypothetical protein